MAQTKKEIREAYNSRTYRKFTFRVRRNSELCEQMREFIATDGTSLSYLVNSLLAEHFGVAVPEAWRDG